MTRVEQAVRGAEDANPNGLIYAAASMITGALLEALAPLDERERLEGLAATLPDLFATIDPGCLSIGLSAARLASQSTFSILSTVFSICRTCIR